MPKPHWTTALLLTAALATFATHAQDRPAEATQVQGVSYAPTLQLQGKALQLNGAGTRYKAVLGNSQIPL